MKDWYNDPPEEDQAIELNDPAFPCPCYWLEDGTLTFNGKNDQTVDASLPDEMALDWDDLLSDKDNIKEAIEVVLFALKCYKKKGNNP